MGLAADELVIVDPDDHLSSVISFTGTAGTTAYIEINAVSYQVANESGSFVWDADAAQGDRHVFTAIGENINRNAGGVAANIEWTSGAFVITIVLTP